ncbi:MAG: hypothetical protein JST80_03655 [Bdellovibrionales bacterium]|nr:hypothetical protein [Bdellovibrionales bacterium]
MKQQVKFQNSTVFTVIAGIFVVFAQAQVAQARNYTTPTSLPRVESDFNMVRLFQIQSGDLLLASLRTPVEFLNRSLQVRFRKDVTVPVQGDLHIGTSCVFRAPHHTVESPQNYTQTALPNSSSRTVKKGTELEVQNISIGPNKLQAEFANAKTREPLVEMICANPKIRDWTVMSFDIRTNGVIELRSNIQRDPASASHGSKERIHSPTMENLQGTLLNGYFGSGLPGTSGIQLMIGSNPRAFVENGNRAIWIGKLCQVLGEESSNNSAQYTKDSKFAFHGRVVNAEKNRVQFQFRNWSYALESLTIECSGSAKEVASMTMAQVESDLNQSIHFYSK